MFETIISMFKPLAAVKRLRICAFFSRTRTTVAREVIAWELAPFSFEIDWFQTVSHDTEVLPAPSKGWKVAAAKLPKPRSYE